MAWSTTLVVWSRHWGTSARTRSPPGPLEVHEGLGAAGRGRAAPCWGVPPGPLRREGVETRSVQTLVFFSVQ